MENYIRIIKKIKIMLLIFTGSYSLSNTKLHRVGWGIKEIMGILLRLSNNNNLQIALKFS